MKHGSLLVKNVEIEICWLAGSEQRFHQLRLLTLEQIFFKRIAAQQPWHR
jgi:hypothetical protein